MIVKLLAAVLLAVAPVLVSASQPPPSSDEQRLQVEYPLVKRVLCDEGRGSAFRIGPNRFVSAAHVTAMHNCTVDGAPVVSEIQDTKLDYSTFYAGTPKLDWIKVNCDGYRTGLWYYSVGFAWGLPTQTLVMVYATAFDAEDTGSKIMIGKHTFIPGMSGGVVLNSAGEAIGIVNAYNPLFGLSFSRSLKDTRLCSKS